MISSNFHPLAGYLIHLQHIHLQLHWLQKTSEFLFYTVYIKILVVRAPNYFLFIQAYL